MCIRDRFLDRVWRLFVDSEGRLRDHVTTVNTGELDKIYNQTVKKVTEDFEKLHFNTGISQLMVFVNEANKVDNLPYEYVKGFIQLLAPVAPHLGEELWEIVTGQQGISYVPWPTYDESQLQEEEVEVVVQVNGKIRERLMTPTDLDREGLREFIQKQASVQSLIADKTVVKVIAVPGKLVNFVVKG